VPGSGIRLGKSYVENRIFLHQLEYLIDKCKKEKLPLSYASYYELRFVRVMNCALTLSVHGAGTECGSELIKCYFEQ